MADAQAEVSSLESQISQVDYQISKTKANIDNLNSNIAQAKAQGDLELASSQQTTLTRQKQLLAEDQAQLAALKKDLTAAQARQKEEAAKAPPASVGNTVKETGQSPGSGALQLDENGRVIKPDSTAPTNAEKTTANEDASTGSTTKKQAQTQATGQTAGTAAAGDDKAGQTNATRAKINQIYEANNGRILPQPNVLSNYATYTYNISIYILKPGDLDAGFKTGRWNVPSSQLLMQSGGAPTADRHQYFPLDYYIDDLVIKHVPQGKGTQGAHNSTTMTFKVMEPVGFTFIQNLSRATYDIAAGQEKNQNYAAQNYLMVIRFYGYDEAGRPVAITAMNPDPSGELSKGAQVVKYIPFQFTGVKFRLGANKLVTYDCEATALHNNIAAGNARGSIPSNIEVIGSTLGEVCSEFAKKLTEMQATAAKETKFEKSDTYEIVIPDEILRNAKVTAPNNASGLESTPMGNKNGSAAQQIDGAKINTDRGSKKISATAGQSIVQWLDNLIRSSRYITDQQKWLDGIDENGKPTKTANGTPAKAFAWYTIQMNVIDNGYDNQRNDYVYKIIYTIKPRLVSYIDSEYFPNGKYRGEHKIYNHWFTGQNSEVIDLQIDYNYTYYLAVNAPQEARNVSVNYDYREYQKKMFQPTTDASKQNSRGDTNNGPASAAAILYSPADVSTMRMQILGDPAWIQQTDSMAVESAMYFSDGSINFGISDVLYKVQFNTQQDYDLGTGLVGLNTRGVG